MEIWKDIQGYEGLYQVSNLGRIKSIPHLIKANKDGGKRITEGKILSQNKGWHNYMWVALCKEGKTKTFSVHRLVAIAFIKNLNNYPAVNHKDGNKSNNNESNLEWVSNSENQLHASKNGLFKRTKRVKCIETGIIYFSSGEAQRQLQINGRTIRNVCSGVGETAGGFHWEYA